MKHVLKIVLSVCLAMALAAPVFGAEENVQWLVTRDNKQPVNDAPIELKPNGKLRLGLGPNTPPTTFRFKVLPSKEALPGHFVEIGWKNLIPETVGCGPYFDYKSSKQYVNVDCSTHLEIPNLAGWIEYQNKSKGMVELSIIK